MLFDAARSLACSLAMIVTCWLILPILLLLPLALVFGYKFYKKAVARYRSSPVVARLFGAVPSAAALGAVVVVSEILKTYRA
ncbi:hypothetical protein E7V67_014295 [[Empedobacter] haloabium]|uniref:Uncharacterized protein n=1 Tax=[Empedobacter] haloabium TaxID=592317 RepID=A0ABZ1UDJ3_9BURK